MKNHDDKIWEYMDIQYVIDIFEKNKGKKIYCFGAGTASKLLMDNLPAECKIDNFIDNNKALWGQEFEGVTICGPDILEQEKDYVVLVISKHNLPIDDQLRALGLEENKDYYDIYARFFPYFELHRAKVLFNSFEAFVDRIPQNYFDAIPIKYEQTIGVVCVLRLDKNLINYLLAKALLLRSAGYKVSIILDSIPSYDAYCYAEGIEKVLRLYVDEIAEKIKSKCKDIEIYDITQAGKVDLDYADIAHIEKTNKLVLKWFESRRLYGFLNKHPDRNSISKGILENALGYIKAFFGKYHFDIISIYTGMHRHRGMYRYICNQKEIRITTCDLGAKGKMLHSTNGVAAHSEDIAKLIIEKYFSEEEEKRIVSLAEQNFKQRKNSTVKDTGYNYQVVGYESNIKPYDIVIPLNVAWDAAALGRDRIFESDITWLEKTLRYIIENTDATVLVREHPAQNVSKHFQYVNIEEKIPFITANKDRIYFAKAADEVNTYQYIEQCKVVLPYTSTVGVESALLGKNVIIHTDVYYADIDIGYKAEDETDYFEHIQYYLNHTEEQACKSEKNAFLAYYFQMMNPLQCDYSSWCTDWMKLSMEQLLDIEGVEDIISLVGKGIPTIYGNTKRSIGNTKNA